MLERLRKNATKAIAETLKEETLKSLDDIMPVLVGFASVASICIGIFGKTSPAATTITINNHYYGRR